MMLSLQNLRARLARRAVLTGLLGLGASALLVICGFPRHVAHAAPGIVGTVIKLRGQAELYRDHERQELKLDQELLAGDTIAVPALGRAMVQLIDGSRVTLAALTRVSIDRLVADADAGQRDAQLTMFSGVMRAVVNRVSGPSRFEIRTDLAVSAARSTEWIVEVDMSKSAIYVIEGEVDVAPGEANSRSYPTATQEAAMIVRPGMTATLAAQLGTAALPGAKPWDPQHAAQLLEQTTF